MKNVDKRINRNKDNTLYFTFINIPKIQSLNSI